MSVLDREVRLWRRRPISVAAALLQSVVTLLAGIAGLIVSPAFCDGSGLCGVRGVRWGLWLVCCSTLVAVGLAMIGVAISGLRDKIIHRRVVRTEGFFMLAAVCTAALTIRTLDSSFLVLLVLAVFLGVASAVVPFRRGGSIEDPAVGHVRGD